MGDFDVKISIDKDYTVGSTGYLQNPQEIGHGYEEEGTKVKKTKGDKLTWHFKAPKVHDFTWAADPEYIHDTLVAEDGTVLHFLYKDNDEIKENWKNLQPKTAELLTYFNEHIGPYPWTNILWCKVVMVVWSTQCLLLLPGNVLLGAL